MEWKEHLLCVSLLPGLCCSQDCVQLGLNELANAVYHLSHLYLSDIEDLPPAVQEKLFDEVLDRDVQKGTFVFYSQKKEKRQKAEACMSVMMVDGSM